MTKPNKRIKDKLKKPGYLDMPIGGLIIEAGNSVEYKTGDWKTKHPDIDKEKCSNCLLCYIYCPDNSIVLEDIKVKEVDLDHCKGCGICAEECPKNAITMRPE